MFFFNILYLTLGFTNQDISASLLLRFDKPLAWYQCALKILPDPTPLYVGKEFQSRAHSNISVAASFIVSVSVVHLIRYPETTSATAPDNENIVSW